MLTLHVRSARSLDGPPQAPSLIVSRRADPATAKWPDELSQHTAYVMAGRRFSGMRRGRRVRRSDPSRGRSSLEVDLVRRGFDVSFDTDASLRLITESLGLVDRFGASPINVRNVRMADRTLVVEIVVTSADPVLARGAIAGVMGALSGLDVPGLFPALGVQSFGVRAYDTTGSELLWVVSSLEAAALAGRGQPIEWLSRSWLQENTPAYRRSQADRVIGQLETALRDVLHLHASEHATGEYIDRLWPASVVEDLRDRAGSEGRNTADPRALLDFTFLPQLREAIVAHAGWMDDGCLPDVNACDQALTKMNRVRRKVAHHRPIADEDLQICRAAADVVLAPVGKAHPELAQDFLVDRWEDQMAEILASASQTVQSVTVPPCGSVPEDERRAAAVRALETQLSGLESALDRMRQFVVPVQRSELHSRAEAALVHWHDGLQQLVTVVKRPDLALAEADAAQERYGRVLGEVAELRREIQRLRVGMPPSSP